MDRREDGTGRPGGSPSWTRIAAPAMVIVLFCAYYTATARKTDISFDGAIFLQPVVSLERFGTLTHTYGAQSSADFRLPLTNLAQGMFSQTILNWPFIHFFGINHFTLQASNLVFLALTGILMSILIQRLTGSPVLVAVALILFYTLPQMKYAGLGGLGEVPGTFYLLLCALLLHQGFYDRRYFPCLGLAVFLAFHTKNYLILVYPGLLLILAYLALRQSVVRWRDLFYYSIGFWVPFLLLPAIFLAIHGWAAFLDEMRSFWFLFASTQWGTTLGAAPRDSQLTAAAFYELSRNYGGWYLIYIPTLIVYVLSSLVLVLPHNSHAAPSSSYTTGSECHTSRRKTFCLPSLDPGKAVVLLLFGLSVFYLAYWFHFSTWTLWYRRVLPFLVLHIPLLMIVFKAFLKRPRRRARSAALAATTIAIVLLGFAHLRYFALVYDLATPDETRLPDRIEATKVVNSLPSDLQVFGIGWWQAPRLSLFSGRIFLDLTTQGNDYEEGYLVLDPEAKVIDPQSVQATLTSWQTNLIWENGSYSLYHWTRRVMDLTKARHDGALKLLEIGPRRAFTDGRGFYPQPAKTVAMWARTAGAAATTVLVWEDVVLNSRVSDDGTVVTASVPRYLYKTPGEYAISLYDSASNQRSAPTSIIILAPTAQ